MFPNSQPSKMTPEAFVGQIAEAVLAGVKTTLNDRPPQWYDIQRQTPTGPIAQKVQLPQILAELTDTLKVNNELLRYFIGLQQQVGQVTEALKIELEENRKLAVKVTKKNKRKFAEDEDDE